MSIQEDFQMFSDIWRFYKEYAVKVPKTADNEVIALFYQEIVKGTGILAKKYNTELCKALITAIVKDFDRRITYNEKYGST